MKNYKIKIIYTYKIILKHNKILIMQCERSQIFIVGNWRLENYFIQKNIEIIKTKRITFILSCNKHKT